MAEKETTINRPYMTSLAVAGAFSVFFHSCSIVDSNSTKLKLALLNQQKPYELVVQDLNKNGKLEKYYVFNKKKFFLEIDGKNLESSLVR